MSSTNGQSLPAPSPALNGSMHDQRIVAGTIVLLPVPPLHYYISFLQIIYHRCSSGNALHVWMSGEPHLLPRR